MVNSDSAYFPGDYNYIAKESKLQSTLSAPLLHQSDGLVNAIVFLLFF